MSTKTIEKQLNNLNLQLVMLRSVVINVVGEQDPEGQYRPEFVDKMLKLMQKKQKGVKFTNSADFLKLVS
jgi:hypothetical protein